MAFETASAAIVKLAWERLLGFDDGAFQPGGRLTKVTDSGTGSFVQLFDCKALLGPQWFLDRAAGLSDEELVQHSTLLSLGADHGARGLGAAELMFADDLEIIDPSTETTVSLAAADKALLSTLCPVDDVNESGIAETTHQFTIVSEQEAFASAGYQEWQGLLAHLSLLVRPDMRRNGFGLTVAGIAAQEALGAGLIPQWRVSISNQASQALATKLGFVAAGLQTSVLLQP
ncbi:acetyltransferase [Renibacterium salmoninarum ATCC 33209]|uniref:Acetyltransferase n=1 Tax=Renibacterium salmoninarum (strain ATCC 33209 / DSM 20767 / JCM 11484 / NBRC 15589 / NCIMB 2235) TaxID=288705 RepID=A9WNJ1_RENSM|nr:GNAT family N-acetyltransferase [Renibacterium salmoninarum]ABY22713.1 acetyltransferase [Renibacterium salmoninarum ATCC 33209]